MTNHLITISVQRFYYNTSLLRNDEGERLFKDIPAADLAQAIRLADKGIYQLEPTITGKLVGELNNSRPLPAGASRPEWAESEDWKNLTEREREVLRLIATGATN